MKFSVNTLTNILGASILTIMAQQVIAPQLLTKKKAIYIAGGISSVGQYLTGKKEIDLTDAFNHFLPKSNAAINSDLISEINKLQSQIEQITQFQTGNQTPVTPTKTTKKTSEGAK